MPDEHEEKILLQEHEELVSLYIHESKIKWTLINVYIVLSVGLAAAIATLIQKEEIIRIGAVSFLCFVGFLFSLTGSWLFQKNTNRISKLISKGIGIENVLKEKFEVFKIYQNFLKKEEHPRILYGLWFLTAVWALATVGMILHGLGLISLPFFP